MWRDWRAVGELRFTVTWCHENLTAVEMLKSVACAMVGSNLMPNQQTVLFICTGNYYRSRFAELYFNHVAARDGLQWRAFSRGLEVGQHPENVGAISTLTVAALAERGIVLSEPTEEPEQLTEADLEEADVAIAVKEQEHRPGIRRLFPEWENSVEYWTVHDLDAAPPETAIPELEGAVDRLLARLRDGLL